MADFLNATLGVSERIFYGNSLADWLVAGIVAGSVWSGLSLLRRLIAGRSARYSTNHRSTLIRLAFYLIGNTKQLLVLAVALYAGQESLTFPPKLQHVVSNVVLILVLLQVGLWAGRAVRFYLEMKEMERGADRLFAGSLDVINFVARMLIWSLLILVALDNLGVNITALLAGLGVGGVAVALALQNILGDLFASLSIALDKPFVVGDSLNIDTYTGSVEHIGIKTTRLRSETGEQIILSNADILKSRVRNYGRMPEQRVLTTLRVAYSTPSEKLAGIPKLLEGIVREQTSARFDRCHLKSLGESSLQFELSYFAQQPKLNPLMDLQQTVNLRIVDDFRRLGIEFAYPTQRVVLEG
ncbi:MAG: mechanosensitive ion channel protein MscS [Gammaproteobacteria bacterium]|nr:mechanosensitive ion channel protein MscS [Gammaproteobacteria bacterium]